MNCLIIYFFADRCGFDASIMEQKRSSIYRSVGFLIGSDDCRSILKHPFNALNSKFFVSLLFDALQRGAIEAFATPLIFRRTIVLSVMRRFFLIWLVGVAKASGCTNNLN